MRSAWLIVFVAPLLTIPAWSQPQSPRRISPADSAGIDRRVALVVGNSAYRESPLRNPGNDARAVAAALQRLNFQVTIVTDVTRRQLDESTQQFAAGLKSGDLAVFYYSGHGAQLKQENYLIPVDFQGSSASDLKYNGFPASQIRDRLEESSARVRVMILDACRDNPFRGVRGGAGGLASMTSPAVGTLIAYATAENSTADDNRGEQYGLYTKHLLTALSTPGLSLKQVFQQARDSVWTQGGRKQLPYVYDGIVGDVMLTGGVPATSIAPTAPDPASLAWERAKDSHNRAMLEAIVREFPDSPYARLARVELAGMAPEPRIPSAPAFDANAAYARALQLFNAKDYTTALPLLRQCADAGRSDGMHLMGWFYQNGFGVAQDYHAAMDWYRKATELGNLTSMNNLGFLYETGQGIGRDYATAMQWYRRAADGGLALAMSHVGYLYENGLGVPQNRNEAASWYQKGASAGDDDARKNLQRLSAATPAPAPNLPPPAPIQRQGPLGQSLPGVTAENFNGVMSLRFDVTYYCRNSMQFGQVSTCGSGSVYVNQQTVTFRGQGDCQMGDACGNLLFTSPRAKTTLKFEGGREGDTVSIYFSGTRRRFGNLKPNTPFMLLLAKAFDDFQGAYASVQ